MDVVVDVVVEVDMVAAVVEVEVDGWLVVGGGRVVVVPADVVVPWGSDTVLLVAPDVEEAASDPVGDDAVQAAANRPTAAIRTRTRCGPMTRLLPAIIAPRFPQA